jgi:nucleotide-binding universal stress UspA family protein
VRVVSVGASATDASHRAEEAPRFLRSFDIPAEGRCLPASGHTADLLLKEVRDLNAGMLVMGAFGRSALAESLFGSTTLAFLNQETDILLFQHH